MARLKWGRAADPPEDPTFSGDVLMLTGAIRDLHRSNPGQFQTDVRTHFPELWTANPWITPMEETDPGVEVMEAHYPSIGEVGHSPRHFVERYGRYLAEILGVPVRTTAFRGDVHLTEEERELSNWPPSGSIG